MKNIHEIELDNNLYQCKSDKAVLEVAKDLNVLGMLALKANGKSRNLFFLCPYETTLYLFLTFQGYENPDDNGHMYFRFIDYPNFPDILMELLSISKSYGFSDDKIRQEFSHCMN